jgi:REP element-mobilizing transposase RayT
MSPTRKRLAHGVSSAVTDHPIVFLTVCTQRRIPWLADDVLHQTIRSVWEKAKAWLVGRYTIMPNHVHLFAGWNDSSIELDAWVQYWKSQLTKSLNAHGIRSNNHRWQSDHWDTRLRSSGAYAEKWDYVRNNPVRRGLVGDPEDWPYQGVIFDLRWD